MKTMGSEDKPNVEDLVRVLALSAKYIARKAGSIESSNARRPKEIVECAKADWIVATFDEGVAECDAWLRCYGGAIVCTSCNGKKQYEKRHRSSGCDGDHWGDCDRDCPSPQTWTEWVPCAVCDATGLNKSAKLLLG